MTQNYAKAFRIIRAAFGYKQSELAARMSVTSSQLSLIEAGKRQPSLKTLNELASAVRVPAAVITLLASTGDEFESSAQHDISELARLLLKLLVSAKEEPHEEQ